MLVFYYKPTGITKRKNMRFTKSTIVLLLVILIYASVSAQNAKLKLTIDGQTELTATLVENSSVTALLDLLRTGPLTIAMRDYGNMEKVGAIGTTLPRNDEQITTEPGDIILYQGSALVIYYTPNSWSFTRLGKIDNVTQNELKTILGDGDVTVTLEIADTTTGIADLEENRIHIFPNPAEDFIEVSGQFENITLLDINGRKLFNTTEAILDLSSVSPGIYVLNVESGSHKPVVTKIIKRRN